MLQLRSNSPNLTAIVTKMPRCMSLSYNRRGVFVLERLCDPKGSVQQCNRVLNFQGRLSFGSRPFFANVSQQAILYCNAAFNP
jgi:hypothetical protein